MGSKTALVTGGAGFVGSHLVDRLVAHGYRVIVFDSLYTGSMENIRQLPYVNWTVSTLADWIDGKSSVLFLRADVQDAAFFRILPECDLAFNFACPASPKHYQRDPAHTVATSVLGAMNIIAYAERTGARLVHASTSEVYGDPAVHPQPESYWGNVNPLGPRACYDEGKRCAETLIADACRSSPEFDARVVRIFNTYGPRMAVGDGRVIPNFIVSALSGKPLEIYGSGDQTRCLCYIDDLIDGIMAVAELPQRLKYPMNLGNSVEYSILELAHIIREMCNSNSEIIQTAAAIDDPTRRRPLLAYAERKIAYVPKINLRTGLYRTIADFQSRLGL